MILPGYGPAKRKLGTRSVASEVRDEQAFPREELALQSAEQPPFEFGLHVDSVCHVHQGASFGAHDVASPESQHHGLHIIAKNLLRDCQRLSLVTSNC
jgi:hypothetical protein